ncbi:MAG: hypothetical protein NC087_05170 [Anaeroplasma bactoclasticum]|nr:hypothetical protein [Anaeroplasma bactoclasticum]
MTKWYGSLDNRLEEGKMFVDKIEVGTGVTKYSYSDRYPYEVTKVINQKHIFIRGMEYKRIDNNGMSDAQSYEYISQPKNFEIELVLRNGVWYRVVPYSKAKWEKLAEADGSFKTPQVAYNYFKTMAGLTEKQNQKIEEGKEVKKYVKMNISIGVMDRYFDYGF